MRRHISHLHRRNDMYYFRMAVPLQLQSILQKREWAYSLKTKDIELARYRCRIASNKMEQLTRIVLHMTQPTRENIEHMIVNYFEAIRQQRVDSFLLPVGIARGEVVAEQEIEINHHEETLLSSVTYKDEVQEVIELFKAAELDVPDENSPEFKQALFRRREAQLEAERMLLAKMRGEYYESSFMQAVPQYSYYSSMQPPAKKAMTLAELISDFSEAKRRQGLKVDSIKERERRLQSFMKSVGKNTPINTITKKHLDDFMDVLKKQVNLKNKSKLISPRTRNHYMGDIGALLGYAEKLDYIHKSPYVSEFHQEDIPKGEGSSRDIYDAKKIERLFSTPTQKSFTKSDGHYWVPLVALYTGARRGEVISLKKERFKLNQDIPTMFLEGTKNDNAEREIPIPPQLIELGFLDYVSSIKHEYIFPKIMMQKRRPSLPYAYPGKEYYKTFSKALDEAKFSAEEKRGDIVFHSFRNTLITKMDDNGIADDIANKFVGHAVKNQMRSHYSKATHIPAMLKAIDSVDYGVDWDKILRK